MADLFKGKLYKTIFYVVIFSIAMAYLESAIVVYLRALYYPMGFVFPLKIISHNIAITEFFRELATLVMLLGIGIIAGRSNIERFAFFIFSFAIWDIFYYVFLKFILNWPESFLTWDILFMIPLIWVGPVIAPIINSLTMILLALIIIYNCEKRRAKIEEQRIGVVNWVLLIIGSFIVIVSYTMDYTIFMLDKMTFTELLSFNNTDIVIRFTSLYIPSHFNWYIFFTGVLFHLIAIARLFRKKRERIKE